VNLLYFFLWGRIERFFCVNKKRQFFISYVVVNLKQSFSFRSISYLRQRRKKFFSFPLDSFNRLNCFKDILARQEREERERERKRERSLSLLFSLPLFDDFSPLPFLINQSPETPERDEREKERESSFTRRKEDVKSHTFCYWPGRRER